METPGLGSENRLSVVVTDNSQSGVTSGTTYSANESTVVVGTPDSYTPIDPAFLATAKTGAGQDIAAFLAKPLMVASGLLSTSDTFTTPVYSVKIPHGLLSNILWKNKVDGLGAFRGTLRITIQINATRFQQGRYILAWIPDGGAQSPDLFTRMHSATLCQVTQLPHVEIDLACDTEASMEIPHVNVQGWAYLSLSNNPTWSVGSNGKVILVPYSPLVAPAGTNYASYSIFASWSNVEMALPMNPQSNARVKVKVRRKNASEREQRSQDMGPIESGLTTVATVGRQLSAIPLLASVAGPVTWAVETAAKVASAFGWSRPHNSEHAQFMQSAVMHRFTNTDVADNSIKLAYTDRNELEDVPGFAGSNLDEMSLSYINSISAWYKTLTWQTTDTTGVRLLSEGVTPKNFATSTTQGTDTIWHLTPIAFTSSFFKLWRGTIKLKFKLVKTEFHSGRLMVSFMPYDSKMGSVSVPNLTNTVYLHRMILDVREGNEFTFVFPFATLSQYKATNGSDTISGYLFVDVLNELTAPNTVSSSIKILIEACAGDDFELAGAAGTALQVCAQYQPQSGRKNVCEIVSTDLGISEGPTGTATARACVGELVLSFRSIIKRFTPLRLQTDPAPAASDRLLHFYPYMLPVDCPGVAGPRVKGNAKADLLTLVSSCYAIARGSVRFKFIDTSATPQPAQMLYMRGMGPGGVTNDLMFWSPFGEFVNTNPTMAFFKPSINGGAEVEFPYYNKYFATAVADLLTTNASSTVVSSYTENSSAPKLFGTVQNFTTPSHPLILRGAGEDYSLGLFVSVPPMYDFNATDPG